VKNVQNKLEANELSAEAFTWYQDYLSAVDNRDIEKFSAFLAPESEFQFGNQPKVVGRSQIVEGLKKFWQTYNGEEHILHNILGNDHNFALEADNVFERKNGSHVSIPAVATTKRNGQGLVTSFRVFIDISPLYA